LSASPLENRVRQIAGTAVPVRGNDCDTDRIVPARYLKEVTFDRMGEYPFIDERFDAEAKPKPHPFNEPKYRAASILLVNANFGCGSSREHAPQALYRWGIRAIIGESFAPIFAGNSLAIGLPVVTVPPDEIQHLMGLVEEDPSIRLELDLEKGQLRVEGRAVPIDIPDTARTALVEGYWDSTAVLAANMPKVREIAARIPYLTGFDGPTPGSR
jgi:3-isopropylmalate/(R)-2-methylmalate dehydratase small subunit